jgi:hypothetical protein
VKSIVDRRFNRARYDATRTIDAFARQLRHDGDLVALAADLRSVVTETMRPQTASLWLALTTAPRAGDPELRPGSAARCAEDDAGIRAGPTVRGLPHTDLRPDPT